MDREAGDTGTDETSAADVANGAGGPVAPLPSAASRIHDNRWWTLAVLCLSLVLTVAGNASLNVALPDIQARLGAVPSELQWIVDIYALVFAGLLLPAGALADRFGRKTALQGGLVVFMSSALLVSTLGSETWHLVLARAVMGLGAAFIMPGTLSILTNVFHDPAERRRAIAIWAGFAGLGGAVGTVVSGFLLEHYSWTATFLVNVPIAGLALVAGLWLVPNSSDPHEAKMDPPGALLAVAGLGTLLFAIIEAPHRGWLSPETLGFAFVAALILVAFVRWELHTDHPMLDVRLFGDRTFAIGASTITLQFMAMFGLYFTLAQYLQLSRGYTALETAFIALPVGLFGLIGAPLSARNVARFGPRRVVGSGLIVSGSGLLLLALSASPTVPLPVLLLGFSLVGLGNGQTTAPSTTLIMNSVPRSRAGVGSAVNDLSRELGGALGIAVLGSVLASIYRLDVGRRLGDVSAELVVRAEGSITGAFEAAGMAGRAGDPDLASRIADQAREAFSTAFGRTMFMGACVMALNSAIVWRFQGRHRSDTVPDRPAAGSPLGGDVEAFADGADGAAFQSD